MMKEIEKRKKGGQKRTRERMKIETDILDTNER